MPALLSLRQAPHWLVREVVPHGLRILAIIIGALILRWVLIRSVARLIERSAGLSKRLGTNPATRVLAQATGANGERRQQRTETLASVLRSIITGLIFAVSLLMILAEFQLNVAPVLASAGVAGVALGFGAQNLVRDFLTGTFIVLEDQYGVGDVIKLGEITGTVEAISLRITQIRDLSGVVWYVRNGEILNVANLSQGWTTATVDLPLADTPAAELREQLAPVVAAFGTDPAWTPGLLEQPYIQGVESLSSGPALRIIAKALPDRQAEIERELLERCLTATGPR